jgi:ABC transporter DrrB family efflux protein
MSGLGIAERLREGTVVGAEGYVFELERRGYIKAGPYVPEVVLDFPEAVTELHREFLRAGADVMVALTYYAVGFRFQNGAGLAVAMIALATVFGLAICCIAAYTGLAIGDEESVQAFGLIWLFPLTFLSSAFVPIQTMPGWLQAFANNQPVTYVINAMRAMALGGPIEANLLKSVAWLAGIFIVFAPLAVRAYKRAS